MVYCRNCGKEISEEAKFCPFCGISREISPPFGEIASKEHPSTKIAIVAIVIIMAVVALVGIPLSYVVGQSAGYASGQSTGYASGYSEGLEKGKFTFYYWKPEQKYGVDDLEEELRGLEWVKAYQEGVFDCSEMSAFIERHLENKGWHTDIIVGDSPFGSGLHCWLLVETSPDGYMPVESTHIGVVLWSSPHLDNYFEYDRSFQTIQEALAYSETEFDWWSS